ncbi:MAG: exodeoxyribonuclease VII large subunit [Burkholderiaceae bacterium]|nr:exodeoxyribonuclease VII large subunit [Burkholderiaceae bacterium]
MSDSEVPVSTPRIWQVGALCRAIADALESRFNPVAVQGEISGFSRASSGHCYFSLKDGQGQIRCAMFRRAASLLDFSPRDGALVELRGRLGVYEPRGDLQLIVESMRQAGQGALFEQFLRLKAKLEAEGLFDAARKRPLPLMPRGIGLVTSLGAAALHDVVTALRRRAPHIPVFLAPAAVQGSGAPAEIVRSLESLYRLVRPEQAGAPHIDLILLVRGGGSIEDLWAFNDERLARAMVRSPVPLVCGVGHETDFTIADFCADLRAPTPTAAAELAVQPREVWLGALDAMNSRLADAAMRHIDRQAQRLDQAGARLGRPSGLVARQQVRLAHQAQRLRYAAQADLRLRHTALQTLARLLPESTGRQGSRSRERLERARLRLDGVDPRLVLLRGYAWLMDGEGHALARVAQAHAGQTLTARLADGELGLRVTSIRPD